jgi:putative ABC transport system ATP-binding protein
MAGHVIEIRDLKKVYRMGDFEVHALKGVDLTVERGDLVAIMGPSGSGKSTLMNTLGCLDRPTSGTYLLDGVDVSRLDRDQRAEIRNSKIGFVFQSFNLLARTRAIENVELPLLYSELALSEQERTRRAREALARVGLGGRENHYPSQLSGGQQQRVAIARALVTDPAIVLADEPTGNLDTRTSEEIMEIFQELNDAGKTVILITHEVDIASHAKRVIYLRDGVIWRDERIVQTRANPEAAVTESDVAAAFPFKIAPPAAPAIAPAPGAPRADRADDTRARKTEAGRLAGVGR